jgi:leucyl aminopeptidase
VKIKFATPPGPVSARALPAPSAESEAWLARLDQNDFKAEPEEVLPILTDQGWRVLVGMGERAALDDSALRRIGGNLFAEMAQAGIIHLGVGLDRSPEDTAQVAYGIFLRAWRTPAKYRKTPDPEEVWHLAEITMLCDAPDQAQACFARLESVGKAVHFARDLVVAPGNVLTPPAFVEALSSIPGVEIEVIDPKKAGLNLLQAVGQGSVFKPALAVLRYLGAGKKDKPAALVGKGITFDTGGIDIKPAKYMEMMKGDMGGGAAVAGALMALAARNAPVNVVGVVAIAENAVSGRASRPGDVVKSYSGLTVEIIDTDAEGRLVLADALAYAAKQFSPTKIIDLATLTGAVEIALGFERAGLFANNDALAGHLFLAGEAEDEKLWRLPLTDAYDHAIKSDIADLKNCSWERGPDHIHAARFLQHFVPDDIPWAHLDIAGLSEAAEDGPLAAEGPTGFGVRLLDRVLA